VTAATRAAFVGNIHDRRPWRAAHVRRSVSFPAASSESASVPCYMSMLFKYRDLLDVRASPAV
jgi:hypothetical protein